MNKIKLADIKKLREATGAGIADVKKALEKSKGNFEKAREWLREKGASLLESKSSRRTAEGVVVSYIHPGYKVGALLELNCETDFVARNDEFIKLAKELAMQVAGMNPLYIAPVDVPKTVLKKEEEVYRAQMKGKSKEAVSKAVEGKIEKFFEQICLLKQPLIKNDRKKVEDLLAEKVASLKENIKVGRFVRFVIGEGE